MIPEIAKSFIIVLHNLTNMSCALVSRRLFSLAANRIVPSVFVRSFARLECAGVAQERKEMRTF